MNDRSPSYDDELRRLEAELQELRQRADQAAEREARVGQPRQPRLARTCREDHDVDDYPETGQTFWIQFLDSTFTETEGDQTPTHTERQEDGAVVAHSLQGHIAEDTVVFVFRDNGRWWIWKVGGGSGVSLLWGRVQQEMDYGTGTGNGPGVLQREVNIKDCTHEGVVSGSAFTAWTPYLSVTSTYGPGKDTNLWIGSLVNYQQEPDETYLIVSDIWDDAIGTIKAWNTYNTVIRDGWRECEGTDGAPDTRGRYLRGVDSAETPEQEEVLLGGGGGSLTHTHCDHATNNEDVAADGVTITEFISSSPHHPDTAHVDPWRGVYFIERFE